MTIERRLEKLTERHEALTQTVEIIAAMQENERRFAETDRRMGQVLESITHRGHIAEARDYRRGNIEGCSH